MHFRDLKVAAPLKPDRPGHRAPPERGHFRDLKVAAPLKLLMQVVLLSHVPISADLKVAAPLKRPEVRPQRCIGATGFPRPKGRGPIEARLVDKLLLCELRFPRPKGRGPIEALLRSWASDRVVIFSAT